MASIKVPSLVSENIFAFFNYDEIIVFYLLELIFLILQIYCLIYFSFFSRYLWICFCGFLNGLVFLSKE